MKALHIVAFLFVIIGALNWGFIGFFDINIVHILFGMEPVLERSIYMVAGLSALYTVITHSADCDFCGSKKKK